MKYNLGEVALHAFMMFLLGVLIGIAVMLPSANAAEPIKIAIIDTGYNPEQATYDLELCPGGQYDFDTNTPTLQSFGSHGTDVGSVVAKGLMDVEYCAVIYQVMTPAGIDIKAIMSALNMAIKQN